MPVAARSSVLVRLYTRSHVKLMSLWLDATVVEKFRVSVRCCISLVCSIRRFKSRIFCCSTIFSLLISIICACMRLWFPRIACTSAANISCCRAMNKKPPPDCTETLAQSGRTLLVFNTGEFLQEIQSGEVSMPSPWLHRNSHSLCVLRHYPSPLTLWNSYTKYPSPDRTRVSRECVQYPPNIESCACFEIQYIYTTKSMRARNTPHSKSDPQ